MVRTIRGNCSGNGHIQSQSPQSGAMVRTLTAAIPGRGRGLSQSPQSGAMVRTAAERSTIRRYWESQSPQSGAMVRTGCRQLLRPPTPRVSIPSKRGNGSDVVRPLPLPGLRESLNPLKAGQWFGLIYCPEGDDSSRVSIPSKRGNGSDVCF